MKKRISILLVLAMVLSLVQIVSPTSTQLQAKSKKMKINKNKATLYYDGSNHTFATDNKIEVLSIKNPTKKVKWTTSNKKVVAIKSIRGKNKKTCTIKAKKKGKATITAKVGKKKFKCKVTVKKYNDTYSWNRGNTDDDDDDDEDVDDDDTYSWERGSSSSSTTESKMDTFSLENNSVTVTDINPTVSVNINAASSSGNKYSLTYDIKDNTVVSCDWGESTYNNNIAIHTLNIKYLKPGSTSIVIKNSLDNQMLTIDVTAIKIPLEEIVKIKLPECPTTLRTYSNDKKTIYRAYDINSVYYTVQESYGKYKITITFEGQKTYDYQGDNQSSKCSPGWKLYSSDDFVLKSGTAYSESVAVGEKFKCSEWFFIEKDEATDSLRLEILNTN